MGENKYKRSETSTRILVQDKKDAKEHRARKDSGQNEKWRKEKAERNAARPKQDWVPSTLNGKTFTDEEFYDFTDEQVMAIIPAHWERV